MQRKKYLAKNIALFALGNFGTRLISFFLIPLYTNVLTTGEYGVVDLVFTICTVLVPVITFNIGESVMRFSLDKGANHHEIMSIGYVFMGICIVLGTLAIPVCSLFDSVKNYGIYIFLYSVTYGINQIMICNLRGKEKLLNYSISNIINTVCIAGFNILFLVFLKAGVEGYFMAYIISNVITIIYAAIYGGLEGSFRHFKINNKLMSAMLKYSVVLIPNSFMWWIINSSDRLMVTSMMGTEANGIYAVSYKIPSLLSTFSLVFNQAWSYSAIKEDSSADRVEYNNLIYDKMARMLIICTGGLLMIIKPFLSFYVDDAFFSAWKYTPYLFIGFMFTTLGTFISTSYTVNKDSKGFLCASTIGAIANVVLNFILIPQWGLTGAAIATCISFLIRFLYVKADTKKYIKISIVRKNHLIGYLLLALMCGTIFIDNIWGQILLIIEFIVILLLMRNFIAEVLSLIKITFNKGVKKIQK